MRKALVAAVAATAIAAPVALAARPATHPAHPTTPAASKPKPAPVVSYVFKGVLTADAVAPAAATASTPEVKGPVSIKAVSGNVFARRAVLGAAAKAPWKVPAATTVSLSLGAATVVRGKVTENGVERPATVADLKQGDTVILVIRAKKGTAAADLPSASWIKEMPAGSAQPAS